MSKAHKIEVIRDDKSRVRKRPTIYIPTTDKYGAIHIIYEIVDNALDELTANDAVGSAVSVMYDVKSHEVTVIDDGGGIPQDGMLDACTVLNSSGKFNNGEDSHFGQSGGLNGVGNKISVFLSEYCSVTSMQKGKKLTYHFVDGDLKETEESKTKEHGTIVKFKLGQQWVDINAVTKNDIIKRYEEKSYLFPNIKMSCIITDGDKTVSSHTYTGKDINDRVVKMKPDTEICRASGTKSPSVLKNLNDTELKKEKVVVDVSFAFKEALLDMDDDEKREYMIAYGNTIKTYMGGAHVDGLKDGIIKYFKEKVKLGGDKDLQILPSDITAGLCGFVVAKVYSPMFRGQYKDSLDNQEAKFAVRDIVYDALCDMKPSVIKTYVDFVKRVAKGRVASKKTRKKDVSNAFSKDRINKFDDIINNIDTNQPELILVEG